MESLDLIVLGAYLGAVVALGFRFSRRQRSIRDYFLTGKRVPWWALLGSIVATETSTVTFISVPGYAFGGDLTFLQLAFGYAAGKVVVAAVLIPSFFRADFLTAYQSLASRFGSVVGRLTASIFLTTRALSDGFRLFATGLVLAAVLETLPAAATTVDSLMPGLDRSVALLVGAVVVISATTLAYTLLGGMSAVIWTDVAQLVVYVSGGALPCCSC
jgi:Na+/proline symporter